MALERIAHALEASDQEVVAGAGGGQQSTYPTSSPGQGTKAEGDTREWVSNWLRARSAAAGQALNAAIAEERSTAFARQISEFIQLFFKVTGNGGKGCIVDTGSTATEADIKGCEEKRSDALTAAKTLLAKDLKTKQPSKALEDAIEQLDTEQAITEADGQKSTHVCPLTTGRARKQHTCYPGSAEDSNPRRFLDHDGGRDTQHRGRNDSIQHRKRRSNREGTHTNGGTRAGGQTHARR
ncbi:putative Trypanosome variant surface glycoprotein (A type) [Trypanosoma vivax]|nr:putative Trypanosome variant surface glycoprotein (A type) [Trypanosoma vivax]